MKKIVALILSVFSLAGLTSCKIPDVNLTRYHNNLEFIRSSMEDIRPCSIDLEANIEAIENDNAESIVDNTDSAEEQNNTETQNDNDVISDNNSLYNITDEILIESEKYNQLLNQITDAIIDTEKTIEDIQNKSISLSIENKIFLDQEIQKLKIVLNRLTNASSRLCLLATSINQNNNDIENKVDDYLMMLDSLLTNNELLEAGLNSINMMRYLTNSNDNLPDGATGRFIYGYKNKDNPPVIKEFYFNENGLVGNNIQNQDDNNIDSELEENQNEENKGLFTPNIDTYANTNLENNIDTFFNTALLDNQFMYGRSNYGMNPYLPLQNYNNAQRNNSQGTDDNTTNSVDNDNSTQYTNNNHNERRLFAKNIDTYKTDNSTPRQKLSSMKNRIKNLFNPRAENPVYHLDEEDMKN